MSASALRSAGPEFLCPNCLMPGVRPGDRCSGCRLSLELDECAIEAWRGHGTSTFLARRSDGTLVAISPAFASDDSEQLVRTPPTAAALEALTSSLAAQGWRDAGKRGRDPWFAGRLARVVALEGRAVAVPASAGGSAPLTTDRRRAGRLIPAISAVGLVAAGVLAYAVVADSHSRAPLRTPPPTTAARPAKHPREVARAELRKVKLAVSATRTSWLELRRGSRTGRVLFSGELPAGHSLHVSARRLWARFGAAANLDVMVDGKRVALQGTLERVFAER